MQRRVCRQRDPAIIARRPVHRADAGHENNALQPGAGCLSRLENLQAPFHVVLCLRTTRPEGSVRRAVNDDLRTTCGTHPITRQGYVPDDLLDTKLGKLRVRPANQASDLVPGGAQLEANSATNKPGCSRDEEFRQMSGHYSGVSLATEKTPAFA